LALVFISSAFAAASVDTGITSFVLNVGEIYLPKKKSKMK
jgi:hypothetical protein